MEASLELRHWVIWSEHILGGRVWPLMAIQILSKLRIRFGQHFVFGRVGWEQGATLPGSDQSWQASLT